MATIANDKVYSQEERDLFLETVLHNHGEAVRDGCKKEMATHPGKKLVSILNDVLRLRYGPKTGTGLANLKFSSD